MENVIKRSGQKVPFQEKKLYSAIARASEEAREADEPFLDEDDIEEVIHDVLFELRDKEEVSVEEIQNTIEEILMERLPNLARRYIRYRYKREVARKSSTAFMDAISEKIEGRKIDNSNANLDEASFGGRTGEATSVMMKEYALNHCMSEMSRKNHLNNEIYIHDLNSYAVGMHNCLTLPMDDLLANGFKTRQVDIRPAGSINTAMQLVAVLFQLQSLQQFGGVAASHLDWTMVPYVRKSFYKHFIDGMNFIGNQKVDKDFISNPTEVSIEDEIYKQHTAEYKYAMTMTEREMKQAVEGLYHNLNSLQSRSGNQLPFSSINFATCTLPEGRMTTKALLEGLLEGTGKFHRTSIFPCAIFQCMKGVNRAPGDPNYDLFQLALKCTAHRLYPNYANCDWSINAGYDKNDPRQYVSTMGCRTYNGYDINGLGFQKDGRGNIAPVTIILPTLAMEARELSGDIVENFMKILDIKIGEARDMLIERFEYICSQSPASAEFMYKNNTMAGYIPEEGIRSALKHGTLAVGQIGLSETLQILIGCDHTELNGMELAKRIEQLFKDRCAEYKQQYKLNFGVYYSPAESLCGTALQAFRKKYGIIPNVSDREYFTNSVHCPVWKDIDAFTKIDIESQLAGYSSAGNIMYVELPSGIKNNLAALETMVNYAMDKDLPYFAVNVPVDDCLDCGYSDEFNDHCPQCGSENIQQLRRVTGYLSTTWKHFNKAKQSETKDRVKHI